MKETNPNNLHPQELEGKEYYAEKKYSLAADAFSLAAQDYSNQGKILLAAEMRNNQCVSHLLAKNPSQALNAVIGTADLFKEEGDLLKQAMAIANEATALKDLGDNQQAIEKFLLAASIFDDINEPKLHLQTQQSISALKFKTRNLPGALYSMQEGLEGLEKPSLRQKILLRLLRIPQNMLEK